jgi:C4-dicarboxylate-specific signal transduction histidine kinase
MHDTADDIARLHASIDGLLSAGAAGPDGHDPFDIVARILDVLVDVLRLDFACARLCQITDTPLDLICVPKHLGSERARQVGRVFSHWLAVRPARWPLTDRDQPGDGESRIAQLPLGLQNEIGVLVAAASRADFPTRIETIVLRFAVNEAVVRVLESWHSTSQKQQNGSERALNREVTERWHVEKRLREANQATRLILDSISDTFFAFDKEWRYTYLNRQAAEQLSVLGKDPASLIGKKLWDEFPFMPGEEGLRRAMHERVIVTQEYFLGQLGEWVENRIFPSSENGLVVFQRYISERKLAEEALRKAQAELGHVTRLSTMGEMAAWIAHEVNQPLAAVVTNAEACLRWVRAEPLEAYEVRAAVERIVRDANRASAIISRIRAFLARSEAHEVPVDVEHVVQEVASLVQAEARAKGVSLHLDMVGKLPLVLADPVQLQQVILNLVMNAMDAMRSVRDSLRVLVLGAESYGMDAVLIRVRDNGIGIDPGHRDRVFNAFYTTKRDGMGMGLAISRSIVEAHGGRIWVTPNADDGETFQFTLPIRQKGD